MTAVVGAAGAAGADLGFLVEEMASNGALAPHLDTTEDPVVVAQACAFVNSVPVDVAEYTGGIVPEEMGLEIRDAYQTAGITQAQAAELLGLSRPHLANALAGRYPLSEAKVVQLHEFLAQPPPVVQPRLI